MLLTISSYLHVYHDWVEMSTRKVWRALKRTVAHIRKQQTVLETQIYIPGLEQTLFQTQHGII